MYRLLIVDDEQVIREGLRTVVNWEDLGFTVTGTERNGQRALEHMAADPVDAILADIRMSRMSGLELARKVSVEYPGVRVVILSGYDHFGYAQEAISSGIVFHYLLKPCREEELRDVFGRLKTVLDGDREKSETFTRLKNLECRELLSRNLPSPNPEELRRIAGQISREGRGPLRLIRCCLAGDPVPGENTGANLYSRLESTEAFRILAWHDVEGGRLFLADTPPEPVFPERELLALLQAFPDIRNSGWTFLVSSPLDNLDELPSGCRELEALYRKEVFFVPGRVNPVSPELSDPPSDREILRIAEELAETVLAVPGLLRTGRLETLFKNISDTFPPSRKLLFRLFRLFLEKTGEELKSRCLCASRIDRLLDSCRNLLPHRFYLYQMEQAAAALGVALEETAGEETLSTAGVLVAQVIRFLEEEYPSGIGLNQAAERFSVTPAYLSRVFKQVRGENFKDYLTGLRMTRARELLAGTNGKVYEISGQVGFHDSRYFSELFKKVYGLSPLEYRNRSVEPV